MLNTVFQMTYHKNVSRKNSTRSMRYMIVSVNAAWFRHSALPKYLSLQPWIFMPTMTRMGSRKDRVRKKYDSVNLQPKMMTQSMMDASRDLRSTSA
jgi:hypothetical protein